MKNTESDYVNQGFKVGRARAKNQINAMRRHRMQYAVMLDQEDRQEWSHCDYLYRQGCEEGINLKQ